MSIHVLQKNMSMMRSFPPEEGVISCTLASSSNLYLWELKLVGPKDSAYEEMKFNATLKFPRDFPMMPPEMRITSPFWHPNVYPDGRVCMTILHPPQGDQDDALRWSPVLGVDKIVLSFISLLSDPDPSEADAPANVDALSEWRYNRPLYLRRCALLGARLSETTEKSIKTALSPDAVPSPTSYTGAYAREVRLLQDMGFTIPIEELLSLLARVGGDVEWAANLLAGE